MKFKPVARTGGRRLIYFIVTLVALVALVVLMGGAVRAWIAHHRPNQPDIQPEQVIIAVVAYTGSCPVVAAQANGYFTSVGIQVHTPNYTSGKAALDAALSGHADLGVSADLPVMFAAMDHRPVSVVATISRAENDQGIVGRKDRGIAAPADLKGKHIGVTAGTSGHFVLDVFLTRHHLSARDVILHDLKPEALSGALARGEIDAASTWEPIFGRLQTQLGGNGTTFVIGDVYTLTLNVAGTQHYVASHEQTLEKIVRALMRGAAFCEAHPDEARELLAGAFKVDAADLKASWSDYRFHVTLDQSLLLELEDESRWAIRNTLTTRTDMPNYLNYLHLDALRAVAPAAVTVIQ